MQLRRAEDRDDFYWEKERPGFPRRLEKAELEKLGRSKLGREAIAQAKPLKVRPWTWYDEEGRNLYIGAQDGWIIGLGAGLTRPRYQPSDLGLLIEKGPVPPLLVPRACSCTGDIHLEVPDLLATKLPLPSPRAGTLTPKGVVMVVATWLYGVFFDALHPTKPILMFWGDPGSGKTTAARALLRLLFGPNADVYSAIENPRDLGALLANNWVTCIDGLDKTGGRLANLLSAAVTGVKLGERKLYSNFGLAETKARSWLIITTFAPELRADIADRSIVIAVEALAQKMSEAELQAGVLSRRGEFWGALLHDLRHILDRVGQQALQSYSTSFRMADFAKFGGHVWSLTGEEEEWERLLDTLQAGQAGLALEDEPLVEDLRKALAKGPIHGTAGEIVAHLYSSFFDGPRRPGPKTVARFLREHRRGLERAGIVVTWQDDPHLHQRVYSVTLTSPQEQSGPASAQAQRVGGIAE